MSVRERMTDGRGLELFAATPDGIERWVRTTSPTPPPEDVVAYVRRQRETGRLSAWDVAEVERRLPEVGPIG